MLNLNREFDILKCLYSIQAQTYKNYEVIIIDNASTDGSIIEIKKKFPEVVVFKTIKNLGTSYTRNAGVKFANGELIWFLDNDTYLPEIHTISNLVQLFIDDPSIDGIGGEAEINKNNEIVGTKKLELFPNGLTKGYFYQNEKYKKISVKVIATCNLLIKKEAFEKVGGFDHFYFFYFEDIDLTYRISQSGFNLYVYHKCPVVHNFSESSRFNNHFKSKRNRIYFILKNLSIKNIIFLPLYDFFYIVNLDNLKRIYKKFFHDQKNYNNLVKRDKKKISLINIFETLKITSITLLSILASYIYIPIYFFKYSFRLRRKINFLNKINNDDFTIVK